MTDVGAVTLRLEQVQILRGSNYAQAEGGAIRRMRLHKTMNETVAALPFARARERKRDAIGTFVRSRTDKRTKHAASSCSSLTRVACRGYTHFLANRFAAEIGISCCTYERASERIPRERIAAAARKDTRGGERIRRTISTETPSSRSPSRQGGE